MKRISLFISLLLALTFTAKAQLTPLVIDSFDLARQIAPITYQKIDSSATSAKKTSNVAIKDTVRITVYDTIRNNQKQKAKGDSSNILSKTINPIKEKINAEKNNIPPAIGKIINFHNIFWSLMILVFSYFVIQLLVKIVERFAEKSTAYRIGLKGISPFIRIIGWTIALIWVVQGVFQPSGEKIFAFMASAGLAIGFASQDILKNIFGGIMILFDRPFQVGDKIEVGSYYGEVKEIGLRSTRIVTKDDSLVSVPNAEVVNNAVSNSNAGEANCQVVAEIYLPIDVETNKARLIATEAAQVSRYIYLNKPITVLFFNVVKEHRSYVKMRLKAYVSDIRNEFAFQSDMTEIVLKEFIAQGIIEKREMQ